MDHYAFHHLEFRNCAVNTSPAHVNKGKDHGFRPASTVYYSVVSVMIYVDGIWCSLVLCPRRRRRVLILYHKQAPAGNSGYIGA